MSATISSAVACEAFASAIDWDEFQFGILESPERTCVVQIHKDGERDWVPEQFAAGLLFGPSAELRWRRRCGGLFHVVLIHDRGGVLRLPGAQSRQLLARHDAGLPSAIRLWGDPDGDAWYDARIPRAIVDYPAALRNAPVLATLAHYSLEVDAPSRTASGVSWPKEEIGDGEAPRPRALLWRCCSLVNASEAE